MFVRDAPLYQAISTEETVFADPRFAVINDPTPRLDHLVPRLPSNAFEGKLPSLPLAVTEATGRTGSVGGVAATVNDHVLGAPANGLPAASVAPAVIVAVYVAPAVRSAVGFRVATVLPELIATVADTGVPPPLGWSVKVEVEMVD